MVMSLDFWNFVIAFVALLISIYAVIYSHLQNKLRVGLSNGYYDKRKPDPFIIGFTIENLSSKPIKLIEVAMKNESGDDVAIIDNFEPTQTFSDMGFSKIPDIIHPFWDSEPFQEPLNLQPNSEISFSYYIATKPPKKLTVIATFESLSVFKKKKKTRLFISLKKNN